MPMKLPNEIQLGIHRARDKGSRVPSYNGRLCRLWRRLVLGDTVIGRLNAVALACLTCAHARILGGVSKLTPEIPVSDKSFAELPIDRKSCRSDNPPFRLTKPSRWH